MGLAQGARLVEFSVLPSQRGWGYVRLDGGHVGWLMSAAPYVCDLLTFVIGYIWSFRIPPHRRWLFVNVFVIAVLSPLIDSVTNYLGVFYPGGDVGYLARVLGAATVHGFFIAVFFLYAIAIARVLTRCPTALGEPANPRVQPPVGPVTVLAANTTAAPDRPACNGLDA